MKLRIFAIFVLSNVFCTVHSADDYTLTLRTFDALSYVQTIPQDVREYIKSLWYKSEPVTLHVKPYSLYKQSGDYPVSFDTQKLLYVGNDGNNKSLMHMQLCRNDNSYVAECHSLFHTPLYVAERHSLFHTPLYVLNLNSVLQSNPVRICGPSNSKNGFCFVNEQLWALSTRERFICSNYLIRSNYTEVGVEKVYGKNQCSSFTPRAIAPDGSRCVLELNKNSKLWLCDLQMVNRDINITYDPLMFIALCSSNKVIRIIKLCELDSAKFNQKICMPRQDSVVMCNLKTQTVCCFHYKNIDSNNYVIDIPNNYIVTDLYGIDRSPHFALDMVYDNKEENNLKKRVLGVWSLENGAKPVMIGLDDELQRLSVAPNLNTPKLFNKVEEYKRALYIRAQTSLFWNAALCVRIAQQLAEKIAWNTTEKQMAQYIIGIMRQWAKNGKVNPYYFCWLAQNSAGDSNYFREVYVRLYNDGINSSKFSKQEDYNCIIS